MNDYSNDSHIRLIIHSNELLRRSEEARQRAEKTSNDVTRLLEHDQQLNSYLNEFFVRTTPTLVVPKRAT